MKPSNTFDLHLAERMVKLSSLVYDTNMEGTEQSLKTLGAINFSFYDYEEAEGFLVEFEEYIVVAFRGTEIYRIRDFLTSFELWAEQIENTNVWALQGYVRSVNSLWDFIVEDLSKIQKPVIFTGHSMGAAMALIAGIRCKETHSVYTFASPKCLLWRNAKKVSFPVFRVYNGDDIVVKWPFLFPYEHVGEEWCFDKFGLLSNVRKKKSIFKYFKLVLSILGGLKSILVLLAQGLENHHIDQYEKLVIFNRKLED